MPKCSFDKTIECSQDYRSAETTRQMNLVLRSGAYWFRTTEQNECGARAYMCPRFLEKQRQKQY